MPYEARKMKGAKPRKTKTTKATNEHPLKYSPTQDASVATIKVDDRVRVDVKRRQDFVTVQTHDINTKQIINKTEFYI